MCRNYRIAVNIYCNYALSRYALKSQSVVVQNSTAPKYLENNQKPLKKAQEVTIDETCKVQPEFSDCEIESVLRKNILYIYAKLSGEKNKKSD